MKNQRRENGVSTTGRTNKRAKKDVQSKLKVVVKEEKVEEEQEHIGSKLRDSLVGEKEPDWALTHWNEHSYDWLWLGSVVDYEQMSWGSVWEMGLMGETFNKLYGDVVWDDDIWNLRTQIPSSSCTN